MKPKLKHIVLSITVLIYSACRENEKYRDYAEKETVHQSIKQGTPFSHPSTGTVHPSLSSEHVNPSNLIWDTPKGWKVEKGTGFRTATLYPVQNDTSLQCVVIKLQGDAGGLKNNVIRWMKQLGMIIKSEKFISDFIKRQETFRTKGNFPGAFIDMTSILSGNIAEDKSGMVGVITTGGNTIYVRMFGPKTILLKKRGRMLDMCKSFRTSE